MVIPLTYMMIIVKTFSFTKEKYQKRRIPKILKLSSKRTVTG
jgi:hypothetical protein